MLRYRTWVSIQERSIHSLFQKKKEKRKSASLQPDLCWSQLLDITLDVFMINVQ